MRLNAETLTTIANINNLGYMLVDAKGIICDWDERAREIFNLESRVNLEGKKLVFVFQQSSFMEAVIKGDILKKNEQLSEEKVINTAYYPIFNKNDKVEKVFITFNDISGEYKLSSTNAALSMMVEIYEAILDEVLIGLTVTDKYGNIMMMNQLYGDIIGVESNNSVGCQISDVVKFTKISQVLKQGTSYRGESVSWNNQELILTEHNLKANGKVIGAVSKIVPIEQLKSKDLLKRFRLLENKLLFYKEEIKSWWEEQSAFSNIIGESAQIKQVKKLCERVAKGDANVLLTGESGTGKELFAQAIHYASMRKEEPFVKINCAAIPENLLESELFGYEEGAFTGAVKGGKVGKFELANGGTIFLDEIGDMPLNMQAKILRVIQERTIEKVGGHNSVEIDVRIIAATNRDLEKLVEQEKFRLDLYYRLCVITAEIPPLKERREDIVLIAEEIIKKLNKKYNLNIKGLALEVEELFINYLWPGNVRQMENVLEYAFNLVEEDAEKIVMDDLPTVFLNKQDESGGGLELETVVTKAEIKAIKQALQVTGGNKQEAANLLGIHRSGFYQKLKKYKIEA